MINLRTISTLKMIGGTFFFALMVVVGILLYLHRYSESTSLENSVVELGVTVTESKGVISENAESVEHDTANLNDASDSLLISKTQQLESKEDSYPSSPQNVLQESVMAVSPNGDSSIPDDLQPVIKEFKSSPGFREKSARKIIEHLSEGMTVEEVTNLLGQPTDKDDAGRFWRYSVFYSKTIEIYFDTEDKVKKIVSVGIDGAY